MNELNRIFTALLQHPLGFVPVVLGLWLVVNLLEGLWNLLAGSDLNLNKGVTKKALCAFAVQWCEQRMGLPSHRKRPKLQVCYSTRRSRRMGSFRNGDTIVIHVNQQNNRNFRELANTIIHEYTHVLQLTSREKHISYSRENKQAGYEKNRFEVEARQTADALEKELLEAWIEHNYLSKN